MLLHKNFLFVSLFQIFEAYNSNCNKNLASYWTSNWRDLKERKEIFLVLSRSTNRWMENVRDSLPLKKNIQAPIVIKPTVGFPNPDLYGISFVAGSDIYQEVGFATVLTGNMTNYGIRHWKFKQMWTEHEVYGFFKRNGLVGHNIVLLGTCKMTTNAKKEISVQEALILFVLILNNRLQENIEANLTAFIESAKMQDYLFDEFGNKGVGSCENLRDHMIKCKAAEEKTSSFDFIIPLTVFLFVIVIAAVKTFHCIYQPHSNRVQDMNIPS